MVDLSEIDDDSSHELDRFMRGSLILARTKAAESATQRRRASKKRSIQSGGILTVGQRRHIVKQKAEKDLMKARRVVKAANKKQHNMFKMCFFVGCKNSMKMAIKMEGLVVKSARYGGVPVTVVSTNFSW